MPFTFRLPRIPGLPTTATAPFCPSEVAGTVAVPPGASVWQKLKIYVGPGLLVSIGYMDPGNWATSIQGGSQFGYQLLFVVMLSSLAAIVLQCLCARLGIATGKDLAVHSREHYPPMVGRGMWIFAELSIIACDLAEVLGCALAFNLLLGVSLPVGVLLTALDTLIVLGLKGRGFRQVEAIILGLVITIAACLLAQLAFVKADWHEVMQGFVPSLSALSGREPLYLAIGIIGATVMPHNLYLHSSIVQTRVVARDAASLREAVRYTRVDTILSLLIAMAINATILILAASAFQPPRHHGRAGQPVVGGGSSLALVRDDFSGQCVAGGAGVCWGLRRLSRALPGSCSCRKTGGSRGLISSFSFPLFIDHQSSLRRQGSQGVIGYDCRFRRNGLRLAENKVLSGYV